MALRGETVGRAYVRILADGSGLDRSIKDEFDRTEPLAQSGGDKHAYAYRKGFSDHMKNAPMDDDIDGLVAGIKRNAGKMNAVGKLMAQGLFDPLEEEFRARHGEEIGARLARDLAAGYRRSGGDPNFIDDFVERLHVHVDKVTKDIQRDEARFHADREAAYKENARRVDETWRKQLDDAYRMNVEHDKKMKRLQIERDADFDHGARKIQEWINETNKISDAAKKNLQNISNELRKVDKTIDSTMSAMGRVDDEVGRGTSRISRWLREIRSVGTAQKRSVDETRGWARNVNKAVDVIGKGFGKGARNNFVNLIGVVVGGVAWLAGEAVKLAGSAVGHIANIFKGGENIGAGFATLGIQGFGVLAAGMAAVTFAAPLMAAALTALSFTIGPIFALISGLAGIVAALASTITFGLIGAVTVLAGALVPLAAGAGVLALAFIKMTDAQKKALKEGFAPIKKAFGDLRNDARDTITGHLAKDMKALAPVVDQSIRPVVMGLSRAIRGIGDDWTKAITSQGFQNFMAEMKVFLPHALRQLGTIAENTIGGIGGVFQAATPLISDFLGWLTGVTQSFQDWANSAKGQTAMQNFFRRAGDSAQKLGGFLGTVWDILVQILDAGKGTGDNIFDDLTNAAKNFLKFISPSAPAMKGTADIQKMFKGEGPRPGPSPMEGFFKNAKQVADDIGAIVKALAKFFDQMDDQKSRDNLHKWGDGIDKLASALQKLKDVNDIGGGVIGFIKGLGNIIPGDVPGQKKVEAKHIGPDFGDMKKSAGAFFSWLQQKYFDWGDWIKAIPSNLGGLFKLPGWANRPLKLKVDIPDFSKLNFHIPGWATKGFDVPKIHLPKIDWPTLPKWITGGLRIFWQNLPKINWPTLPAWITGGIRIFWQHLPAIDWPSVPDWLTNINIDIWPSIHWPSPPSWLKKISGSAFSASGGIFTGAQHRIIGEAGPEAVVPLAGTCRWWTRRSGNCPRSPRASDRWHPEGWSAQARPSTWAASR